MAIARAVRPAALTPPSVASKATEEKKMSLCVSQQNHNYSTDPRPKLREPWKAGIALLVLRFAPLRLIFRRASSRYLYRTALTEPKAAAFILLCHLRGKRDPVFVWYILDLLLKVPEREFDDRWIAVASLPIDRVAGSSVHQRISTAQNVIRNFFGLCKLEALAAKESAAYGSFPTIGSLISKDPATDEMQDLGEYQERALFAWADAHGVPLSKALGEKEVFANLVLEGAQLNDPKAQFLLAGLYGQGHGLPADPQKSLEWLQKAADGGSSIAECTLGYMYALGVSVEQNPNRARTLLSSAAAKKFPPAVRAMSSLKL